MSPERVPARNSQQQQQDTREQTLTAAMPRIESINDESLSETQTTTAGKLTPTSSESESLNRGVFEENHYLPPSDNRKYMNDWISEAMSKMTETFAADRSTPANSILSNGDPDPADTQERPVSVSSVLDGLQLLGFNEDQLDDESTTDEEDDDSTSIYSVQQESLPRAPIYDNDLKEALKEIKDHLSIIESDMKRSPLIKNQESDFFKQYQQVWKLSRLSCTETRTVGFIGNSGVGKSRLINSLMGLEGLAHSSANGSACTSVVTEFRNQDDDHPSLMIEVNYMSTEEVDELLNSLIQSFRMYYTDSFKEVTDADEKERIREQSTKAWTTLESMFRNQPELSHEFLADQTKGAQSRILSKFQQWTGDSRKERPGGATLQHMVVLDDIDQCRSYLDQLTMSPPGNKPATWPFINIIRVYLDSPLLATGLVLADLPGFRDLNFARVRATEKYLQNVCNEVFVVTTISRCVTDESIDEIKNRCNQGQPMRIVCTHSEDVRADEYARGNKDLASHIDSLQKRLRRAERNLARVRRGSLINNNAYEDVQNAQYDLKEFLVQSRNGRVALKLEKHGREIRIFCVSNDLYSDNRRGTMPHSKGYFNLSGIPELRRYCQLVPAEAQFRFVAAFLEHRVPAVLRSLKQWALAGVDNVTAEKCEALRNVLSDVVLNFQKTLIQRTAEVRTFPKRLQDFFNEQILTIAYKNVLYWERDSLRINKKWSHYHHGTYAAFCRRKGVFKNDDWNNELLVNILNVLETPWLGLETWILTQRLNLGRDVGATFEKNTKYLSDNLNLAPIALENFIENMESRETCIIDSINYAFENLMKGLSIIKRDAFRSHSSSYMVELMLPAYDKCMDESSSGCDARRKSLMYNHLANSNIYYNYVKIMDAKCRSIFETTHDRLKDVIIQEANDLCADAHVIAAEEGELTEATKFPEIAEILQDKVNSAERNLETAIDIVKRLQRTPMSLN